MTETSRILTLDQIDRMKQTGYEFDCENGVAYYKSGRVVDTRTGANRDYVCLSWTKTSKLWRDGDVSMPYLHRVLYTITHGEIDPGMVIDHIDSNKTNGLLNNSISNLRLTTLAGNQRNTKSNTGFNFVTFHKSNNNYELNLPIDNRNHRICQLSSNKFNLTDLEQLRNHLVNKHKIDISTCPSDQCWTPPTSEQLNSIINRTRRGCKLRDWV